jgi:D-amino-acid dehydrogenase
LKEVGIEAEPLDRHGVAERLGGIETNAVGGVFHPYDGHVTPDKYVRAVAEKFESDGGLIERSTEVLGFEVDGRRVTGVVTSNGLREAGEVVLAAGSWSPAIARGLGIKLPIQPAKGYSVTYRRPEGAPPLPVIFGESRVAVTPMGETMRLAGTLELAGMDLSINRRRVDAVARALGRYFPAMDTAGLELIEEWAGLRPATPDGLALLGRWPTYDNLTIAAGHATIGVSTSPASGTLVAQIVTGEQPLTDIALLDPARFE